MGGGGGVTVSRKLIHCFFKQGKAYLSNANTSRENRSLGQVFFLFLGTVLQKVVINSVSVLYQPDFRDIFFK